MVGGTLDFTVMFFLHFKQQSKVASIAHCLSAVLDYAGWSRGQCRKSSQCTRYVSWKHYACVVVVDIEECRMLTHALSTVSANTIVIRGLAVGTVRHDNVKSFLWNEFRTAICLSLILGIVGCVRAAIFLVPLAETMAITTSLLMIVLISIILGATLPLLMHHLHIDPAHSSTTIQVLMDILGVTITVVVSGIILNSNFGRYMSPDLYGDSKDADSLL